MNYDVVAVNAAKQASQKKSYNNFYAYFFAILDIFSFKDRAYATTSDGSCKGMPASRSNVLHIYWGWGCGIAETDEIFQGGIDASCGKNAPLDVSCQSRQVREMNQITKSTSMLPNNILRINVSQ